MTQQRIIARRCAVLPRKRTVSALLVLALLGACSKRAPAPAVARDAAPHVAVGAADAAPATDAAPAADAAPAGDAAHAADAAPAVDAAPAASDVASVLAHTPQLVVAITADWDATRAELRLYQRDGAAWRAVGDPWPGVVGHAGTAWGTGLHGHVPAGRDGPAKREGDGASPAGVFSLAGAFGYAASAPTGTALPYRRVDRNWKCVDDGDSRAYNRIVDARTLTKDWSSAEDMRRSDALYTWVVEVAHNAQRTPHQGSCIFLHVWRDKNSPTVGCTAMDQGKLRALIAQLDPRAAFVLLPRAEYTALAPVWGLP